MWQTVLLGPIETLVNGLINQDKYSAQRITALAGRLIHIEISDLSLSIYLLLQDHETLKLRLLDTPSQDTDTRIRAKSYQLLSLLNTKKHSDFNQLQIKIRGNVELAEQLSTIMQDLDLDWEEQLSTISGDIIAHQLFSRGRQFRDWFGQTRQNMQQNISEYLQEEAQHLPCALELNEFYQQIDTLRDDTERLNARIQRLTTQLED